MQNTVRRFRSVVKSRGKAFSVIFNLSRGISTKFIALITDDFAQHGRLSTLFAYTVGRIPCIN